MATTNASTPVPRDPTADEALALFKAIEEKFPAKTLGDDKWYLLAVSLIHTLTLPQSTYPLYLLLPSPPNKKSYNNTSFKHTYGGVSFSEKIIIITIA